MSLWMVRGGSKGRWESMALEQGLAIVGWEEMPDLSKATSREALQAAVRKVYPDFTPAAVSNNVGQLHVLVNRMKPGDLVVMPLKGQPIVAVGKVKGGYQFRTDLGDVRHVRPVDWKWKAVPRAKFGEDLQFSMGAIMTVCQIERNNAEQRFLAVLAGKKDPGPEAEPGTPDGGVTIENGDNEPEVRIDIEQLAQSQIVERIGQRFRGHDLALLVDEVLKAEGYTTFRSPPGPDGGADILAGKGTFALDDPKMCVQVKTPQSDVNVYRALKGTMDSVGAKQGLLVAWGGFTSATRKEAEREFFKVRLWDAASLVEAVLRNYDRLSPEIQNELPLKRVWTLVLAETD